MCGLWDVYTRNMYRVLTIAMTHLGNNLEIIGIVVCFYVKHVGVEDGFVFAPEIDPQIKTKTRGPPQQTPHSMMTSKAQTIALYSRRRETHIQNRSLYYAVDCVHECNAISRSTIVPISRSEPIQGMRSQLPVHTNILSHIIVSCNQKPHP